MKSKKLIAGSKKNRLILDLGIHPFADTFIEKKKLKRKEPTYPLKVLCANSLELFKLEI